MENTLVPAVSIIKDEYPDITEQEVNVVMTDALDAFHIYRQTSLAERATFLKKIAGLIAENRDALISLAESETHLEEGRLRVEIMRTIFQLESYGNAALRGACLDLRINSAIKGQPDIRKMMVPLGPVVVFGASNFPFAYSTAGGDTASALAAGCPVIVKAHPAHIETSLAVAAIIKHAANECGMPAGVFQHVHGAGFEVGRWLVEHEHTKAVGFTGSLVAGRQLYDWAAQRKSPIPVFAEMGSVNPVFILPGKMAAARVESAAMLAGSILQSVGQFCTNPGIIICMEGEGYEEFSGTLIKNFSSAQPGTMLHSGVFKLYVENRANAIAQEGVEVLAVSSGEPLFNQGSPTIATVSAEQFLANPVLHHEVFGPWSLIVRCSDSTQLLQLARSLEGQLTSTILGDDNDLREHTELFNTLTDICGRVIISGVPTGVTVCGAMHHGGPYPATTDARFTSVGEDAIRRFLRPVSFQNCSDEFLPDPLKNGNPLGLWRLVNETWTNEPVSI